MVGVRPRYWNYQPTPSDPWCVGGGGERGKDKKEDGGWKEVWGEKKEEEWNLEWFIISRCYKNMLMVCLVILNKEKRKSEARPI